MSGGKWETIAVLWNNDFTYDILHTDNNIPCCTLSDGKVQPKFELYSGTHMWVQTTYYHKNSTLLVYNTVSNGNILPMFRDNLLVPCSLDPWRWDRYIIPKCQQ